MDNRTTNKDFHILAFSSIEEKQPFLFLVFFLIYLIGVLGNFVIIGVIYMDYHLHTPMYYFLCNLSCVDICYTTITLPKLMDILITGNNSVSFIQCFTQMYFFMFMAVTEVILLSSMAYDRYVAICHPLHYQIIMSKKKFVLFLLGTWVSACSNSLFLTVLASKISFCRSNMIQQFYCNIKALAQMACAAMGFYIIIFIDVFLFGVCTFLLNLTSYIKIITSILQIHSSSGRKKAFSTCTSHLTVLIIFYGTVLWIYMTPPSDHSDELDHVFSVLYVAVVPMLNPLIYSLRNKDVKIALIKIVKIKT
ncbi:olfactory receptor 13C9-like [Discoglossus pictus]